MKKRYILSFLLALIFLLSFVAIPASADEISYFYDDSGRLTRVVRGTEGIVYQYDEVGNLLSITSGTISAAPPVLNSITPDLIFIGQTTLVSIKGQNLFTTKDVIFSSPSLSTKILRVTDTEIMGEITVPSGTLSGAINITANTSYGSASVGAALSSSKLFFSPGQLALLPGSNGSINVSISPLIGRDLTILINNSSPAVVSAPHSITIPSSGAISFNVNALKEGIATISSGDPRTVVFVAGTSVPGSLPSGEEIISNAGLVSVYIDSAIGTPTTASLPVSVYIVASSGDPSITSLPVSAYIDTPSGNATTVSLPVNAMISKEDIASAATISLPVSIRVESPAGNASSVALPVSVYIEPAAGNSTVMSLPVSVKRSP
jgi:hypothetical protein